MAITLMTQYDVARVKNIESCISKESTLLIIINLNMIIL